MSDLPPSLIHPEELPSRNPEDEEEDNNNQIDQDDIEEIIEEEDDGDFPMDGEDEDDEFAGQEGGMIMEEMEGAEEGEGLEEEEDMGPVVDNSSMQASQSSPSLSPFSFELFFRISSESSRQLTLIFACSYAALHRDGSSVFEVALHPLHPSPPLAVSGGEDDLAFLFDTTTGKEVVRLSGHTDSVVAVSFSESSSSL